MKFYQLLSAVLLILIYFTEHATAQLETDYSYHIGTVNIFRFSPVLSNNNIKGGIITYETGSGIEQVSLQFAAKYFAGAPADSSKLEIPMHWRFEVQPKLYGIRYMKGVYFAPFFVTYSDFTPSLGATAGVQWIIKRIVAIDMNLRLQLSNDIENKNNPSPIFIRPVATIGFLLERNKK